MVVARARGTEIQSHRPSNLHYVTCVLACHPARLAINIVMYLSRQDNHALKERYWLPEKVNDVDSSSMQLHLIRMGDLMPFTWAFHISCVTHCSRVGNRQGTFTYFGNQDSCCFENRNADLKKVMDSV